MDPRAIERYRELILDREGKTVEDRGAELMEQAPTDIVVLAHGWNNNLEQAREMFADWIAGVTEHLANQPTWQTDSTRISFLGVLWPSKRFDDSALIAGGAASVDSGGDDRQAIEQNLTDLASTLVGADRDRIQLALACVPDLESRGRARREFVRALLETARPEDDDGFVLDSKTVESDTLAELRGASADEIDHVQRDDDHDAGGADIIGRASGIDEGESASFGLSSLLGAARALANFTTFYVMKERASLMGAAGLAPALGRLTSRSRATRAPRLHLIGHSFGARLVSAAARELAQTDDHSVSISSMALLQAAFSHYAFAENWKEEMDGQFRDVLRGDVLSGPVLITHTRRDRPVGIAYAIASRWRNQVASAMGDADDPFGGLGSNGAQRTPEVSGTAIELLQVGGSYDFRDRAVHNLHSSKYISGHGAVRGREVTWALAALIAHSAGGLVGSRSDVGGRV